ncbi:MAG: hypothetical protein WKG07_08245 [Hymenobacter sp.]
MKPNRYFATVFQRRNFIKDYLYGIFLSLASWPRLVLEVFIRRNMGERYFSLFGAIVITLLLCAYPFYKAGMYESFSSIVGHHLLWYLFTAAFAYASFLRMREISLLPSVFDFARFSLSTGTPLSIVYKITNDPRKIATLVEPLPVFLLGALLLWMKQEIGVVLMLCSFIYSMSYVAAYAQGDDFLMDYIDNYICAQDLKRTFEEGLKPSETRGAEFFGRRPSDPEKRQQAAGAFDTEDIAYEVV